MTTLNLSLRDQANSDPRVIALKTKLGVLASTAPRDDKHEQQLERQIESANAHLETLLDRIYIELQQEVATGTLEVAPKAKAPKAPKKGATALPLIVKAEAEAAAQGIPLSAEQGIPLPTWMSAVQGIPKGAEEVHGDLSIASPTPIQDKEAHAPTHVPTQKEHVAPIAGASKDLIASPTHKEGNSPNVPTHVAPLTSAERAYAESIVNGDREELRSYLLSGTPEECVITVLFEYLPKGKKGPSKSTHPNPCQAVWETASSMKGASRSTVVAACVAIGIGEATARTQYQKWYEAGK